MTTCPQNTNTNELVWSECSLGHVNNTQCKNFHNHIRFFEGKDEYELIHNHLFNSKEVKYIVETFKNKPSTNNNRVADSN
jgi:hypothetical protein